MFREPCSVNPWWDVHLDDEMAFIGDGYTRKQAAAAVASEYAGMDQAYTCGRCDSPRAFFRATVGAVQCTACEAVRRVKRNDAGRRTETWI
jgi:hypothetical protein